MLKKFKFYNKNLALDFKIFESMRPVSVSFQHQFDENDETFPGEFQLEITDLQCNEYIKSQFRDITLLDFYKLYLPGDKFPVLRNHARQMTNLFGSTRVSQMKTVKLR
jgi:hypothetical protein